MKLEAGELATIVSTLVDECAQLIGAEISINLEEIQVSDGYLGAGYAHMGAAEKEAIQLLAQSEALLVDPVYTGRAAAGLIDLIRKGEIGRRDRVLFWHTGGTPALFAPRYQSELSQA